MNRGQIIKELRFKAIRSGGSGGQHVNKVSSKIVLFFELNSSLALTDEERLSLQNNLRTRLSSNNVLILNCDESRSQHKNKELIIYRFLEIIDQGLKIPKERKATKPSKASVKKRLDNKKKQGTIKANRKKPRLN